MNCRNVIPQTQIKLFALRFTLSIVVQIIVYSYTIFILGCATHQPIIERAIVRNETGGIISEVRVRHDPTGKIGEVHSILPHSQFELGFAEGPMLAERSTVTWRGQDSRKRSAELELPTLGGGKSQDGALVLFYTIYPDGSVAVELK